MPSHRAPQGVGVIVFADVIDQCVLPNVHGIILTGVSRSSLRSDALGRGGSEFGDMLIGSMSARDSGTVAVPAAHSLWCWRAME